MSKKFTSLLILFAIITPQSNIYGMEKWEQIKQKVTKSLYWYTIKATGAGALSLSIPLFTFTNCYINEPILTISHFNCVLIAASLIIIEMVAPHVKKNKFLV